MCLETLSFDVGDGDGNHIRGFILVVRSRRPLSIGHQGDRMVAEITSTYAIAPTTTNA